MSFADWLWSMIAPTLDLKMIPDVLDIHTVNNRTYCEAIGMGIGEKACGNGMGMETISAGMGLGWGKSGVD